MTEQNRFDDMYSYIKPGSAANRDRWRSPISGKCMGCGMQTEWIDNYYQAFLCSVECIRKYENSMKSENGGSIPE